VSGHKQRGISSKELMRRTGISYRQLDYWERTGVITPSVQAAEGSGTKRGWSENDVAYVAAIVSFLDAGHTLESAVARAKRGERACPVCGGTGVDR
jgi:DNA-binding transcriptional MerR regulator